VAFIVWAAIVLLTAVLGNWMGYGGKLFALALGVAALLFALAWFLAVPAVLEFLQRSPGGRMAFLAPLMPFVAAIVYSFGVSGSTKLAIAGAAYVITPPILLSSCAGSAAGKWEDYAAAIALWLPIQFQWLYKVFPWPPPLTHTMSVLLALSAGVAAFMLVRRLEGVGYAVEWRRGFAWNFGFHYVVYAAIAIFLGLRIGFLTFDPSLRRGPSLPISILGILFFTAWPEEFFFRGILQNLFSKTFKNDWAGLVAASFVFGFSHIRHAPFPNWKYVLMATIAGLFYGHAWMKTRSLLPGVLVHALVDISWHILFR